VVAKAGWNVLEEGLSGGPSLTVYTSQQGHTSLDKAVALMGLGRAQLRRVPLGSDLTIDLAALEKRVEEDRVNGYKPICVVGNAGDHTFGMVDPLADLASFCEATDMWFHVDAVWGGPAASTQLAGAMFAGLDRGDSIALDGHKWLYVPFDVGCILVRDPARLHEAFNFTPAYLRSSSDKDGRFEPMEYIFQLSRSARALKVWMTFLAYGSNRLRSAIEHNIVTMRYMGELIEKAGDFELLAPVPLSAACFRYRPAGLGEQQLAALNHELPTTIERDGRVFLTGTTIRGLPALRACTVNHRTTKDDVAFVLEVVRELGSQLLFNLRNKNRTRS
jgi:glutamate/tyrosine decarboxylase-like PLP-dependent enzyme